MLLALLIASIPTRAQDAADDSGTSDLDTLVAPVALFPDPLLAAVMQASVVPLDIVQAEAESLCLSGQQLARDLGQDTRPVAALAVGGDRAAVGEVGHGLYGLEHDVVPGLSAHARDEATLPQARKHHR